MPQLSKIGALVGAAFCACAVAAPPHVEWQSEVRVDGDGVRSYAEQWEPQLPGSDPALSSAWALPTPDGAYLILPTNTAGGTDYLQFLITPFFHSVRGFQVVRLSETGQVQWRRFVPTGAREATSTILRFAAANDPKAARTPDGGLAMIADSDYVVFAADGTMTLRRTVCVDENGFPPDRLALTREGLMVAWHNRSSSLACAVELDGTEIDRILTSGDALQVLDFRRDIGFLLTQGVGSGGERELQLRSGTTVKWTMASSAQGGFASEFAPAIDPAGYAWTSLGNRIARIDGAGAIVWQLDAALFGYSQIRGWQADGGALMSNADQEWRAVAANGMQRWQSSLGPSDYSAFQLSESSLRVTQIVGSDRAFRHHRVDLQTGALQTHDHASGNTDALLTLSPLGQLGIVDVRFSAPTLTRDYGGSCAIPNFQGYCPRLLHSAPLDVRTRAVGSANATSLQPGALAFPLPTFAFERRPWPILRISEFGEPVDRIYNKRYVHDGIRSRIQIERLSATGDVLWTREYRAEFDLGKANLRDFGNALYVSAQQMPPNDQPRSGKLWAIDSDSGATLWERNLEHAWQRVERFTSPDRRCALTTDPPIRFQCVDPNNGTLIHDEWVSGLPANRSLETVGRVTAGIRARVVPSDGSAPAGFEFVDVAPTGALLPAMSGQFALASGETAHADAQQTISGGSLGTALILAANRRAIGLVVARFDAIGNRIWQRRIDRDLRSPAGSGDTGSIAVLDNGDIYVSMHPRTSPATYRTEICRLSSSGELLACMAAPIDGRIASMDPEGDQVLVWINDFLVEPERDGSSLYRLVGESFGPRVLHVPGYRAVANNATLDYLGVHYLAMTRNLSRLAESNASFRLMAVRHAMPDAIFADGLE